MTQSAPADFTLPDYVTCYGASTALYVQFPSRGAIGNSMADVDVELLVNQGHPVATIVVNGESASLEPQDAEALAGDLNIAVDLARRFEKGELGLGAVRRLIGMHKEPPQ